MWRFGALIAAKCRPRRPFRSSNPLVRVRSFETFKTDREAWIRYGILNKYGYFDNDVELEYEHVRVFLNLIDKEPYGRRDRGQRSMFELLKQFRDEDFEIRNFLQRDEKSQLTTLHELLYDRHALSNGAKDIEDMNSVDLAKSFLGNNTELEITIDEAKLILRQLWQYNKSSLLEEFKNKHKQSKAGQEEEKRRDEQEERKSVPEFSYKAHRGEGTKLLRSQSPMAQ